MFSGLLNHMQCLGRHQGSKHVVADDAGVLLTSSPSKKKRLILSATYFAMVDLPHAVGPVKKKT